MNNCSEKKINISGIFLLNKPVGISSNKALQIAKRIFRIKKAGHTGSLDPRASGMLPICFGEATKFSQFMLNARKKYRASLKLGEVSTTGDSEGSKTKVCRISSPLEMDLIKKSINKFIGKIQQLPPMYSALKHNGQPLYKFARRGIDIPRIRRDIEIYAIDILSNSIDMLELDIECSKGTYIRTLAEDIGNDLGTGAYLSNLHRTGVGDFTENDMHSLDEIESLDHIRVEDYMLPIDRSLRDIKQVEVDDSELKKIVFGQKIAINDYIPGEIVKIMHYKHGLVGLGTVFEGDVLAPKRLLQFDLAKL